MRPMTSVVKVPLHQVFNTQIPQPFVSMCLCRAGATHTICVARRQMRDSTAAPAIPLLHRTAMVAGRHGWGAGTLSPLLPLQLPSLSDVAGYFLHPHCLRALVEEQALEMGH